MNSTVLARLSTAALTVLLQEAIDQGQFQFRHKMQAKALYKSMEPLMLEMYKGDDSQTVAFHMVANVLEATIKHLCQVDTLEEFEKRLAGLAEAVGYEYKLVFEGEEAHDAK